ncbi:1,4-alpha-glucan branching protein [Streptomyces europaeiscabiei]|uniref:maltokinase N-terminal cap-like domain-containing protein n=1 Tax=Streptomyces TaxID=1883 RepID=UPI000A36D1E6|nr:MULTISPECIES: 1,4-alpha-glucan branching protein [Streptomyces]MDX3634148.1 1,4-alpha-glucan branching protein [Streptomyces europaeiscabiei]MDX3652004.1 1,4-alpha-glucan branching protein [Streptomyces europaeiscabiei]
MAVIHQTTLKPTKLELLTSWLPIRPWYAGGPAAPVLTKAGGFRLDDPEGEVGIEFMVATDTSGPTPVHYLAPLTYRGAPLPDAEHALIGTMEHGVLGRRWVYDGVQDPVLLARLLALFEGRAEPQAQSLTDTPDHEVTRSYMGEGPLSAATLTTTDTPEATELLLRPEGTVLHLNRVLHPGALDLPFPVKGQVTGHWTLPDDTRTRAVFAVLR